MHSIIRIAGLVLASALLAATPPAGAGEPQPDAAGEHAPVFADLSPADAGRQAAKEGKLLIIKATAEWCGPCKQMDRTTFRDPRVVEWIGEHAIAIQLDVDESPGGAKALRIEAMPTIVVFKGKQELDRVVGYRDADDLLPFLEGARSGITHEQRVARELAEMKQKGDAGDMDARYDHAQALLREGQYEQATDEFAWLWEHVLEHDSAFAGVRSSFMAGDMERLAQMYPPARDRFAALRDALEPRVQPDENFDHDALSDWIVLNEVVGDDDRTIAWIDRVAPRDDAAKYLRNQPRVFDLLTARGDWALAGKTLDDARALLPPAELMDEPPFDSPEYRAYMVRSMSEQYAALLAAGRTDDARRLAQALIRLDPSEATKNALASKAGVAGVPESGRRVWEAAGPGAP